MIDLRAGAERSVAATKTYTAELLVLAMLAGVPASDLAAVPEALGEALAVEPDARHAAHALAAMETATVIGRGFGYATAREWALKLKELAYVVADPYSAADFQHGPLALIDPDDPVLLVAPSGAALADLLALGTRLRDGLDARLLVVSDCAAARALAAPGLALSAPASPRRCHRSSRSSRRSCSRSTSRWRAASTPTARAISPR